MLPGGTSELFGAGANGPRDHAFVMELFDARALCHIQQGAAACPVEPGQPHHAAHGAVLLGGQIEKRPGRPEHGLAEPPACHLPGGASSIRSPALVPRQPRTPALPI